MVLKNYIDKYNGDGGAASAEQRQKQAYDFFIQKGYTPEQSAGIVGNLIQESGFNLQTQVKGFDGTGSTGMAQWLGSRLENLKKVQGSKWNTFKGQLEFVDWELKNTEKKALQKLQQSNTAEEAALAFSKYYERPHKDYAHNEKRQNYASNLVNIYNKETKINKEKQSTKILPEKTQDSTDPNYFMADIFVDDKVQKDTSTKTPDFNPLAQLEEIFKQSQQRKQNKERFKEELKTYSYQPPQQVEEDIDINQQISALFSDELYNYININD